MQIKIEGTPNFKNLIQSYHKTLLDLALSKNPQFSVLKNITINVIETSQIEDLGLSRFDHKQILISHQLTTNSPKLLLEVYGHELAHFLITFYLQKNIQHGPEWQKLMKDLNLPVRDKICFDAQTIKSIDFLTIKCSCYLNNSKKIHKSKWHSNLICQICHNNFKLV